MEQDHAYATEALCQLFAQLIAPHIENELTFTGLCQSLEQVIGLSEKIVDRSQDGLSGSSVACAEGCAWCCHAQVKVTPLEALVLLARVQTAFSPEERRQLQHRIDNNRRLTEGRALEHRVGLKAQTPCIFLEQGRCTVYPVRPLICRAWASCSRQACREAFASGDCTAEIEAPVAGNFVYGLARQAIEQACRSRGVAWEPLELPRAMACCMETPGIFDRWVRGEVRFKTVSPVSPASQVLSFMDIQVPLFFDRFALSYTQDGTCIEYFLYSREKKCEISTALVISHDVVSSAIHVSKFYPEIYREPLPRYMSAACFFLMIHHAAAVFNIHCDCPICLETRQSVFESFYRRLKDFDFVIHRHRINDNCNVRGCFHDMLMDTHMITLQPLCFA